MKQMLKQNGVGGILVSLLLLVALVACRPKPSFEAHAIAKAEPATNKQNPIASARIKTDIGFRTRRNLAEHYEKHGREFGSISQDDYLRQAQTLRDTQADGEILEAKRQDGVTTRYDRKSGAFLAYNADDTIRTFFKPNDGERYFKRQLNKEH